MGDAQPSNAAPAGTKRKRSVIACGACHDRKVRCNVALQGVPCSNCHQDGTRCEIYRRKIGIPGQKPSRQEPVSPVVERSYPLTPSPGSIRNRSNSSIAEGGVIDHQIAQTTTPAHQDSARGVVHQRPREVSERQHPSHGNSNDRPVRDVVPYFAGESEGLEFLFDQCSPDRPVKGVHYVTPRKTYRHRRLTVTNRRLEPVLPPFELQRELVRCFFYYVFPAMPVVDAHDFLTTFEQDPSMVSPVLLWSMYFAALNFVDKDILKAHRLGPRKVVKEQYYQNAKDAYDSQEESDKSILMVAALLLAMWYVDLEDRDGSWHWIGVATSLCHTVGFHRATNYAAMPSSPFPARERQRWRRIWWCCFYREAWLAQGFGRPMRVHIDDCDVSMPHPEELVEEMRDLPQDLQEKYLPPDILTLTEAWILLLHLSVYLEDILTLYYRPRSQLPTAHQLRQTESELLVLRSKIPATSFATAPIVLIHVAHLEMYFTSVLILLYRPHLAIPASQITDPEQAVCRGECIVKAKQAASDSTNILNRLMSLNAINQSPSMLCSSLMTSMQILVFEIRNSSGLGKSYSTHQFDLHMLVLSQLRKTYWTADLSHNLFIEVMKALNGENCPPKETSTPANEKSDREESSQPMKDNLTADLFDADQSLAHASLDDFFGIFNPFMGLPSHGDELSTSVDWDMSPSSSLALQSLSGRLDG